MQHPRCRIGKITPKDRKVVVFEKTVNYQSNADILDFARRFFEVLRDEPVRSVAFLYETDEGTGSNFILTPPATYSTLIAQCDVLKYKIIESYLGP